MEVHYVSVVASTTFGRLFITMVQLKELYEYYEYHYRSYGTSI